MAARKPMPDATWLETWLEAVRSGASTMSQRKLTRFDTLEGGIAAARRLAKKKGVHLLLLTDDRGDELVAASLHPFKVIC